MFKWFTYSMSDLKIQIFADEHIFSLNM